MNDQNKIQLFEALELRSEYDARISTIKDCLSNECGGRGLGRYLGEDVSKKRISPDFDVSAEREELACLEFKRRKLNSAIQKTNYECTIDFEGMTINLMEALDMRKSIKERIGELKQELAKSAYQTVIYKEGRDIVEEHPVPYSQCRQDLDQARLRFRKLNKILRKASFLNNVAFRDEDR